MNVVFVAPYYGAFMLECIRILGGMGVQFGLISHQSLEALPAPLRKHVDGHYQIDDCLSAAQLRIATRAFQSDWGRVDRLIGYLEQMQVPLATVREQLGIDGMHARTAQNFRNKNQMKQVLGAAGLPVARQQLIRSAADAKKFAREAGFPMVLKPIDGMGSKGTSRVSSDAELYSVLNQSLPSPSNPIQAEQFVTGEEHTCETAMVDGKVVWRTSTYYLPGPLKVLENPWMQYCVLLPAEQRPHVQRFADTNQAALRALGMRNGFAHMEWFLRTDGSPIVNEVGARPPGVNIMRLNSIAAGANLWEAWLRLEVFRTWSFPDRKFAAGCAFLRAMGHGRQIAKVEGREELQKRLGDQIVDARWPVVGHARSSHYEGDGWLILKGATTQDAVDALRTAMTTIKVVAG